MMTPRTRRFSGSTLAGALVGVAIAGAVVLLSHSSPGHRTDLHEMPHRAVPLDANEREVLEMKEQARHLPEP
jgi:hypothetical protein